MQSCAVVVLIGGNGSNLQALIDASSRVDASFHIAGVISHRPGAYGLVRAQLANIPNVVVDHQAFAQKEDFEAALLTQIQAFHADLVVLAGFMRVLSGQFVQHFKGALLNIHPSLLPNFKGLNTHERVLAAKETLHGVTVHFVTEDLDGGPIVAQVSLPVSLEENASALAQRVFTAEHWLYPQVVSWFAENRLKCIENTVTLDGKPLSSQGEQLTLAKA